MKKIQQLFPRISSFSSRGFTTVELAITMGLFIILTVLITVSLTSSQQKASLETTLDTLLTDVNHQQIKAMVGDTEGRTTTSAYGIFFDTNEYTLFHDTYSPSDSTNFVVTLPETIQVSSTLSGSAVIFSKGSGNVQNYSSVADEIIVTDIVSGEQATIALNRYGVILSVTK